VYDTTYKIMSIFYCIKKNRFLTGGEASSPLAEYCTNVRLDFSNYQFGGFADSVFSTARFITRTNGVFILVAPYTNYELFNTTNQ
jgi:hypothetical protein